MSKPYMRMLQLQKYQYAGKISRPFQDHSSAVC